MPYVVHSFWRTVHGKLSRYYYTLFRISFEREKFGRNNAARILNKLLRNIDTSSSDYRGPGEFRASCATMNDAHEHFFHERRERV